MRILVDTHALLWWLMGDGRLSKRARLTIGDDTTQVLVSAASAYELTLKATLGRLSLPDEPERFLAGRLPATGFEGLPISIAHAARAAALPLLHRDPWDRILAAQALTEQVSIISTDPAFRELGVDVLW